MPMMKFVLKILIFSMITSLLVAGCGGNAEEIPAEPPGGAPPGGAPSAGAPSGGTPPGGAPAGGAPQANGSSNASMIPPGDVSKEQEVAKEQAETGKQ
jgi:hypothetical protein